VTAGDVLTAHLEAAEAAQALLRECADFKRDFILVAEACDRALGAGRKLLFAGNGGSSMDAGHLAAELSGRFRREGPAIRAASLADSVAGLTAIANDFDFSEVFARQVDALASAGDVLVLLTTSGRSPNILRAAEVGKDRGVTVVSLTGASPSKDLVDRSDHVLRFPSTVTERVQELMMVVGHGLCDFLEGVHRRPHE